MLGNLKINNEILMAKQIQREADEILGAPKPPPPTGPCACCMKNYAWLKAYYSVVNVKRKSVAMVSIR